MHTPKSSSGDHATDGLLKRSARQLSAWGGAERLLRPRESTDCAGGGIGDPSAGSFPMFVVPFRRARAIGLVAISFGCSSPAPATSALDGGSPNNVGPSALDAASASDGDAGAPFATEPEPFAPPSQSSPNAGNPDASLAPQPGGPTEEQPSSTEETPGTETAAPGAEPGVEPEPGMAEPEPGIDAEPEPNVAEEPAGRLTVFYLDVGGSVMSTDVEDPRERVIVEDAGQGPDGIAVDVEGGHLYWTGMGDPAEDDGFIRRSDLDGSNIVTILPAGDAFTPKQLKIDAENGKLYWSDREGMRVMRANLDGSELETLVTTGEGATDRRDTSRWCVGIALDLRGGYFYWSQKGSDNAGIGSLRRAHLEMPEGEDSRDRSDIEVLFDELPEPIDIDLDVDNGLIYWTDRGDDTVNRAPIEIPDGYTASSRGDREILVEGVREAIGVTLDLERGKLYFTGGTLGRVGMADLDGSNPVDLLNGSAGLTGIAVVSLPP
jgi:hypothetical protein